MHRRLMADVLKTAGSQTRQWWRALRPLVLWLLILAVLFGLHQHEIWIEKTRLRFSLRLEGQSSFVEPMAMLDGEPARDGQKISLGRHKFVVTHPKADRYETNLFIWYGGKDLGQINLNRSMGTLVITADPPAESLYIRGPEFSETLTNSRGMTRTVPTDDYVIEARYKHWQKQEQVRVTSNLPSSMPFTPPLGAMHLTSSHAGATYHLFSMIGELLEYGELPADITGLPEGSYTLVSQHRDNHREDSVMVKAKATNEFRVAFAYGQAFLDTQPAGATVSDATGRNLGETPLHLSEVVPRQWKFTLRREGYEPVTALLTIAADETTSYHTNLVNVDYVGAMNAARQYLESGDYDRSLRAAAEALRFLPGNSAAGALQREAQGRKSIAVAKAFGARGNYEAALTELNSAVSVMDNNAEAIDLQQDFERRQRIAAEEAEKKNLAEAAEKERQERLNRPRNFFEQWMKTVPNSELFGQFSMTVKGKVAEIGTNLVEALTNKAPAFAIISWDHPQPNLFSLRARQDLGTGGWRRCDLVGGQTTDGEVVVVFKVFEFAYAEELSIRALIKDNDEKNMVPIHPSRLVPSKSSLLRRRGEGVELVKGRIQNASGN